MGNLSLNLYAPIAGSYGSCGRLQPLATWWQVAMASQSWKHMRYWSLEVAKEASFLYESWRNMSKRKFELSVLQTKYDTSNIISCYSSRARFGPPFAEIIQKAEQWEGASRRSWVCKPLLFCVTIGEPDKNILNRNKQNSKWKKKQTRNNKNNWIIK